MGVINASICENMLWKLSSCYAKYLIILYCHKESGLLLIIVWAMFRIQLKRVSLLVPLLSWKFFLVICVYLWKETETDRNPSELQTLLPSRVIILCYILSIQPFAYSFHFQKKQNFFHSSVCGWGYNLKPEHKIAWVSCLLGGNTWTYIQRKQNLRHKLLFSLP